MGDTRWPATEVDLGWIAANIPDNVMLLDLEGRIQYINFTVPDLTPEGVRGRPAWDFVGPAFAGRVRDCLQRIRDSGRPDRYETQYVSSTGEASEWESRVAPARRGNELVGFVVVSSNITERQQQAAERRRLHDLSLDLLCIASFDGYFTSVSPRVFDVLGFTEHELKAAPLIEFVHPDDRARTTEAMAVLRAGNQVVDFENRYRTRAGGYRTLSWRAIPEPALRAIYAVARDVTERERLEQELRRSQKMDAVGRLAAGVAHDFNNLLLAIQANAELIRRRATDARSHEYADQIVIAVKSGAALTRQLLGYGRGQPPVPGRVDLETAVDGVLALVRRLLPETIHTEVVRGPDVPPVWADRDQVDQVLLNLCINARDAMPAGGTLTITTERAVESRSSGEPQEYGVVIVSDTGVGIPPDLLEHVFEPFFSTKPPDVGAGLGLSSAYRIVHSHGGTITVSSDLGRGSRFRVSLPTADRTAIALAHAPETRPASGGHETILVAEDCDQVRCAVVALLEGAGYTVLTARDGEEALQVMAGYGDRISAALFDVLMPRVTGPAAARLLASSHPRVRILFMSGHSEISLLAGAGIANVQVLAKPFTDEDLLDRLRALLDGLPTGAPARSG